MKFMNVKIGETFELDGVQYRKTSPVLAEELASGNSRMIRRSMSVKISAAGEEGNLQRTKDLQAGNAEVDQYRLALLDAISANKDLDVQQKNIFLELVQSVYEQIQS